MIKKIELACFERAIGTPSNSKSHQNCKKDLQQWISIITKKGTETVSATNSMSFKRKPSKGPEENIQNKRLLLMAYHISRTVKTSPNTEIYKAFF